jgi:hypothetical protein
MQPGGEDLGGLHRAEQGAVVDLCDVATGQVLCKLEGL